MAQVWRAIGFSLLLALSNAWAENATAPATQAASQPAHPENLAPDCKSTDHQLGALSYRAVAGLMPMKDEAGKLKAQIFFVSYHKLPLDKTRPITFVFNGGPGAASVWLHLGAVGPRRIDMPSSPRLPAPPGRLVDNPQSWLSFTDLVFIDPVGTGYSRPATGESGKEFYGLQEDIQSVGEFIRLYVTRADRWGSPKFLAGESYGTTRAAGLADYANSRLGLGINGVILISSVLNFQTLSFGEGHDLPYALFLPSYTAAAWYHHRLEKDLQAKELEVLLNEVRSWVYQSYIPGLARGDALSPSERADLRRAMARYVGIPQETLETANLRLGPGQFRSLLLKDQGLSLGRMDLRMMIPEPFRLTLETGLDPSLEGYVPIYTVAINRYLREELKFENDLPYEILSPKVHPWNFGTNRQGYAQVTDNLRTALLQTPSMRVFSASGYYDLATPFLGTEYTLSHLGLNSDYAGHIQQHYYIGGHMMYHHLPSLQQLHDDLGRFISQVSAGLAHEP